MKYISQKLILVFFSISLLFAKQEYRKDQFIIYFNNNCGELESYNRGQIDEIFNNYIDEYDVEKIIKQFKNARESDFYNDVYLNRYFIIEMENDRADIQNIKSQFEDLECIDNTRLIYKVKTDYIPNDQYWNQQYYLTSIDAHLAYDLWDIDGGEVPGTTSGSEIIVAVPDVFLEWDHPDLVGNIWQNIGEDADGDGVVLVQDGNTWIFDPDDENGVDDDGDGYIDNFIGWDITNDDNDPVPPNNNQDHGTLVAGCVSASTNNGIGIASVGWSVRIMAMNTAENDGTMWSNDNEDGMLTAAQMGASVINCSWGHEGSGNQGVINTIYNNYDVIIVTSSGNEIDISADDMWPGSADNVINVTATGPNDNFGCWATIGESVDLAAPGDNIRTTNVSGSYTNVDGTSFSSPITAGAIALVWSRFPSASKETIISKIIDNTDYFSDMDGSCQGNSLVGMLGSGRLNVHKALSSGLFPSLSVVQLNYIGDSDGDGIFNPGDTLNVKIIVANEVGWANAENVVATLSTNDSRLTIIDDTINFGDQVILAGATEFTLFDHFKISSTDGAALGPISCSIKLVAGSSESYYEENIEVSIELSLNQKGFPKDNYTIKSSPIIVDLNGDGEKEIFFGSDNGNMYAITVGGLDVSGFPFEANDDIRSSPAVGDVDGDGQEELVFGSKDGSLYILSSSGSQEYAYTQSGFIMGSPALANLDGDNDLEIIFATQSGSSGKLFAIHHDGTEIDGFPVDISEKILVGPAVADLENDGVMDIVAVSWDDYIHVFDANGAVKAGFPFQTSNRFNSPATLVDLDGDGDLEIAAGNDNGNLYVLNHDGTVMIEFDTGDDIRGGIAVADLDGNGSLELLFAGYDDHVHVWDPILNVELVGWPIDIGSNSLAGPVTADLDNDGDLEVLTSTRSGKIYAFHHEGSLMNHFPFNVAGNIEATPAIGDLDNDGDFELILGTTMGLQVIDIKSEAGDMASWKLHRGNRHRSGYYGLTLASVDPAEMITPLEFHVSRNYPNPFNPVTAFRVNTEVQAKLEVSIYDVSGRLINMLINNNIDAGIHTLQWDGRNQGGHLVPTGVYFLQVISGTNQHIQKMALIK